MLKKHLSFDDCEIKFSGGDSATFEGYASVYNGVDSYGDTILPGAFKGALALARKGKYPKMFENHKSWELPIGKWTHMVSDDKGLLVRGEFTPDHPKADMVRAAMRHGTVDGLSIGFRMSNDDYKVNEDGRGRVIKSITELVEISPVTFPADDAARVDLNSVKFTLDGIKTIREFEDFLRDAGGFSKGLTAALVARFRDITRGEPENHKQNADAELVRSMASEMDAALAELKTLLRK